MYNRILLLGVKTLIAIILLLSISGQPISYASVEPDNMVQESPVLIVFSTRVTPTHDPMTISRAVDYTVSKLNGTCPLQIAIYIHGFNRDQATAGE